MHGLGAGAGNGGERRQPSSPDPSLGSEKESASSANHKPQLTRGETSRSLAETTSASHSTQPPGLTDATALLPCT